MLRTQVCELLGIEYPIMQAAIVPAITPELVAAVSNAGGLGSLGAAFQTAESLKRMIKRTRELTDRPFAINHVVPLIDEEAFRLTLAARPPVVSLALGDPGDLVKRGHDAGLKVIHQVHTVQQACLAAECGVDLIIAQGSEAGGMTGSVGAFALIPQVVDAVHPIPVLAAGGIADGRGLAAALVLGAQGINIGTRFLASAEASAHVRWKQAIVSAESEEMIKVQVWPDIFPLPGGSAYDVAPRAMRTSFITDLHQRQAEIKGAAGQIREELLTALHQGRLHELAPFTGQTAGMVHDILPAAEIVCRLVAEAEAALKQSVQFLK